MLEKLRKNRFLFEELVKRDFKKKYKRTMLGILWSLLSPLLTLLAMSLIFTYFFGRNTPHYTIYLFSGNLIYTYFVDATNQGMTALEANSSIFTKINVPKYLFLFSKNVSSTINFALTLVVYFIFVAFDGIPFTWNFFLLLYPILCLTIFNLGMGLILSALHIFFKDIQYLYNIFTMILMYASAIFYTLDMFPPEVQTIFKFNPIYDYIVYFRTIVIDGAIPTLNVHLACLGFAAIAMALGMWMYRRNNYKFFYYV